VNNSGGVAVWVNLWCLAYTSCSWWFLFFCHTLRHWLIIIICSPVMFCFLLSIGLAYTRGWIMTSASLASRYTASICSIADTAVAGGGASCLRVCGQSNAVWVIQLWQAREPDTGCRLSYSLQSKHDSTWCSSNF